MGSTHVVAFAALLAGLVALGHGMACGPLDCAGTTMDGRPDLFVRLYYLDSNGNPEPFCMPSRVTIRDGNYAEQLERPDAGNSLCSHRGATDRPGTYRACIQPDGSAPFELDEDLVVRALDRCTMQGVDIGVVLHRVDGGTPCAPAP